MNSVQYQVYKRKMSNLFTEACDVPILKKDQIPPHMQEVAILSGYRSPTSSISQCALSLFFATNETLNFWTHFLPFFYFIWQLITFWDILKIIADPYSWPFAAYMFTICLYPLISALAHAFYSISNMARHVWFFLDYGALTLYGFGAGLLIKAYVFPSELQKTFFGEIFLEGLVFISLMCAICACYSRFLTSLVWVKIFRLGAFALPWLWDNIPVAYRILHCTDLEPLAAEHYCLQFFFSFLIGFFYASHLPERLAPGKFDFFGHSHQLLHVSGILATHQQMSGALIDMKNRRDLIQARYAIPEYWSVQIFCFVSFSILITIIMFTSFARNCEKRASKCKIS